MIQLLLADTLSALSASESVCETEVTQIEKEGDRRDTTPRAFFRKRLLTTRVRNITLYW